jgi:hypothetical protein
MARPKVNTSPVADQYTDKPVERIVEFSNGAAGGPGGLASFRRRDDGSLGVSLYRLDDAVTVAVEGFTLVSDDDLAVIERALFSHAATLRADATNHANPGVRTAVEEAAARAEALRKRLLGESED